MGFARLAVSEDLLMTMLQEGSTILSCVVHGGVPADTRIHDIHLESGTFGQRQIMLIVQSPNLPLVAPGADVPWLTPTFEIRR